MYKKDNLGIFVDADPFPASMLEALADFGEQYGRVVEKRCYGNWDWSQTEKGMLKRWQPWMKKHGFKFCSLKAHQKTQGMADQWLYLDVMQRFLTQRRPRIDRVLLVANDGDYAPLAHYLRQNLQTPVWVIGHSRNISAPLQKAANRTITLESLLCRYQTDDQILDQITQLIETLPADPCGWVRLSQIGSWLRQQQIDIGRHTSYSRLSDLLLSAPERFEVTTKTVVNGQRQHTDHFVRLRTWATATADRYEPASLHAAPKAPAPG
mgnify:CR=1 FL=1